MPTVDEPFGVYAGEKTCQVLVVNLGKLDGVEVNVLQLFDEVENITLSQVVREGGWDELV